MIVLQYIVYKSISIVMSVLITLLTVSSCSLSREESPVSTPVEGVPIEEGSGIISILQSRDEISQTLQQAVEQYASANPGSRFTVHTVAGESDYSVALRSRLLSGEQVDIFHVQSRNEAIELRPQLDNLSDLAWIGDAVPGTLDAVTIDGGVYGIPYSIEGLGLIVNTEIFAKANLYVGDIYTVADLEELCRQLQQQIGDGDLADILPELRAVTELSAQDKSYLGSYVADLVLTEAFPNVAAASVSDYLEAPMAENAKELIRVLALYSACTSWDQLNQVPQTEQLELGIASGRVAMILQSTEAYGRIISANPGMLDKLRLLPLPLGSDDSTPYRTVQVGVPAYWCVNAAGNDNAREASRRFLTWLYQSDSGTAVYAGRFMAASPYRATAKATVNPLHSQLVAQLEQGGTTPMLHSGFPSGWGEEVFAAGFQGYFAKELTWEELIQACKEEWRLERTMVYE